MSPESVYSAHLLFFYHRGEIQTARICCFHYGSSPACLEAVIFQNVFSWKYDIKSIIKKGLRLIGEYSSNIIYSCSNLGEPEVGHSPVIIYNLLC